MKSNNAEDLSIHHTEANGTIKRRDRHDDDHAEEHAEGEPWIVSYADMMTLLFCFFVIMTSFANFDPVVVTKKSKVVADFIHHNEGKEEVTEVKKLEQDVASNPQLQGVATSTVKDGSMEVVFSSTVLFPNGGADVETDFYKNIDILIGLIKNRNADYRIIVEGHTDANDAVKGQNGEALSGWSLSSTRAAKVVDRFLFHGFTPAQMVSVGYGDARPVAPSFDKDGTAIEENQALNRRVVIKVLQPMNGAKIKKLKMDNYFENSEILDK